ncbi:MAG: hypothetical protein AAF915_18675 [Cyanobacteria bacterium P01_D01_bin.50]
MSPLLEALNRIAQLSPNAIKPGVTTKQIDEYSHYYYDTNFKLSEEFYQFYQFSDGLDNNFGRIFNIWQAIIFYSEVREEFRYYSAWLPISHYEECLVAIRGDSVQRKTVPIIQINYTDLSENYDWEPRFIYSSLTEMIVDIAEQIEYPYG